MTKSLAFLIAFFAFVISSFLGGLLVGSRLGGSEAVVDAGLIETDAGDATVDAGVLTVTDSECYCAGERGPRGLPGLPGKDGAVGAPGSTGTAGPPGTPGFNTLIRQDWVAGCIQFSTGLDKNRSGKLEDTEVEDENPICPPIEKLEPLR